MSEASNIATLPIWKEGSTAEEFLLECAMVARTKPHMFEKLVIVFDRQRNDGFEIDYYWRGGTTIELIGMLELAKMRLYGETTHE